jgi:ATP-dependent DNA helicase RecQ
VIVYAPTIKTVESTVDALEEKGIQAIPYHGQMQAGERRKNQEQWMADEVRVLVGTIAFGLGINKANVRAVVHLSLPKSTEQYYQEAGRAGRDGEPADCALLWRKKDVGLLAHFIGQVEDPEEKERAWRRYHKIREFAESKACRHRQICMHFGETPRWESCKACDVCGCDMEWLTSAGEAARPGKRKTNSKMVVAGVGMDPALREYLREWRSAVAREDGVPAYVVLHDAALDELCRIQPRTMDEVRSVHGFGERKTEMYGPAILFALKNFRDGARAAAPEKKGRNLSRRAAAHD